MYSPRIYESQVPSLYHAAKHMQVPMTQLTNAFVYYGLISGYYGSETEEVLPRPNQIIPTNVSPRMNIFNPHYYSIADYMNELPEPGTLNAYFQTLDDETAKRIERIRERKNERIPF